MTSSRCAGVYVRHVVMLYCHLSGGCLGAAALRFTRWSFLACAMIPAAAWSDLGNESHDETACMRNDCRCLLFL
jgi:hypothetical protein